MEIVKKKIDSLNYTLHRERYKEPDNVQLIIDNVLQYEQQLYGKVEQRYIKKLHKDCEKIFYNFLKICKNY